MYENFAVGIQLNSQHKFDYAQLSGLVDFAEIHIGGKGENKIEFMDSTQFADMVQRLYDAGLIVGVTFDLWIGYYLQNQYTMKDVESTPNDRHPIFNPLFRLLKNKAVSYLTTRVYEDSLLTNSGQVTSGWISFAVRDIADRLLRSQLDGNLRKFPIGVYSRKDFIDRYAPSLDTLLSSNTNLFISVPKWVASPQILTIADFSELKVNATEPQTFGWNASRETKQNRGKIWSIWETGQCYLYGVSKPVRHLYFNGTREEMISIFKASVKEQPQPKHSKIKEALKIIREQLDILEQEIGNLS